MEKIGSLFFAVDLVEARKGRHRKPLMIAFIGSTDLLVKQAERLDLSLPNVINDVTKL